MLRTAFVNLEKRQHWIAIFLHDVCTPEEWSAFGMARVERILGLTGAGLSGSGIDTGFK